MQPATAASTCIAAARLRCRVAWATFRARHDTTTPTTISCHSCGSRCRMSNPSAINARADPQLVSIRAPNSDAANSNTSGVPSPPSWRPAPHPAASPQRLPGCQGDADPPSAPPTQPRHIRVPRSGGEHPTPATTSPPHPTHPPAHRPHTHTRERLRHFSIREGPPDVRLGTFDPACASSRAAHWT